MFYPQITSNYFSWSKDKFEYEIAIANLGIGITAIIAAFSSYNYKKATITIVSIFLLGDAVGHIYQINTIHNLTILCTDFLIPMFLWISLVSIDKNKNYGFLTKRE